MIRLESLKFLEAVSKTKSIGKAADSLFMSKSAMSSAIKTLEAEIGVNLLERSVYGVELTPAGKMVIEKSGLIFEILDQMKAESWLYKGIDGIQEMHYYMQPNFSENIFPGLLQHLQQVLGSVRMKIHTETDYEAIMYAVKQNEKSLGFYLGGAKNIEDKAEEIGIKAQFINQYEIQAVMAKHSKFVKDDLQLITQEELYQLPFVWYEKGESNLGADSSLDNIEDIVKNIRFSTASNSLYYQALKNDIGVGMLTHIGGQYSLANRNDLQYIPIKNPPIVRLYLFSNCNCSPELKMKHENILQNILEI